MENIEEENKLKHCTVDCDNFEIFKKKLRQSLFFWEEMGFCFQDAIDLSVMEAKSECNRECMLMHIQEKNIKNKKEEQVLVK